MNKKRFGQNVRIFRVYRGMLQKDLAHAAGLSLSHISHLETGKICPSIEVLLTLCFIFNVTPNDMLKGCMLTKELIKRKSDKKNGMKNK